MVQKAAVYKAIGLSGVMAASILSGCKSDNAEGPIVVKPVPISESLYATTQKTAATTELADPVIATVSGVDIHSQELQKPLMEVYGLNMLMLIVQRDMARDACRQQGLVVSPADITQERTWTLDHMFEAADASQDKEKLLAQFLAQPKTRDQMSSDTEFNIVVETNAYLGKLVEPRLATAITDDVLHEQFDDIYGATASVRDIVVSNPQEAMAVRARLNAGADFATMAQQFSRDPRTGRLGGELPPFTLNSTSFPQNFRDVAFSLKPGEISDPVEVRGSFHILKLEHRNAPKAVKFEDVKDSLREDVHFKLRLNAMDGVRKALGEQAIQQLKITDPILAADFQKRIDGRNDMIRDREKIKEQMEKERNHPTTIPAPVSASQPATTTPAPMPTTKPPATTPPTPAANATKPVATLPAPAATSRPAATTRP